MEFQYFSEIFLLTKTYNLQDLKDWLRWHLEVIGFDHVVLFDNESEEDVESLCKDFGDKVEYHKREGIPWQYELYNEYINAHIKSRWVLPIDDDEFVYVSERYHHRVNEALQSLEAQYPEMNKLCIGWLNLFPEKFLKQRTSGLIENATGYSHEAVKIWRQGDLPVKTFCKMTQHYEWANRSGLYKKHNPFTVGHEEEVSYLCDGQPLMGSRQETPTSPESDLFVAHYQFKSDQEWRWKCVNRKAPSNPKVLINHPDYYGRLYRGTQIEHCFLLKELWRHFLDAERDASS